MDKLELDARVALLERRLSLLIALLVLALATSIALALMMTMRGEARPAMMTVATPSAATRETKVETKTAVGGVDQLDAELRKLHALQQSGLINAGDFQEKKELILANRIVVGDFARDIQVARKLADAAIINNVDYDELKKKILEIGH